MVDEIGIGEDTRSLGVGHCSQDPVGYGKHLRATNDWDFLTWAKLPKKSNFISLKTWTLLCLIMMWSFACFVVVVALSKHH